MTIILQAQLIYNPFFDDEKKDEDITRQVPTGPVDSPTSQHAQQREHEE
jgi:hypothetical protein